LAFLLAVPAASPASLAQEEFDGTGEERWSSEEALD
jgi:hypothetical protein